MKLQAAVIFSFLQNAEFTFIVGYTSCRSTYIESFMIIFGQCINVLNFKLNYTRILVITYDLLEFMNNLDTTRVLIGQKPIDYCASKLIENRARESATVNKVQFSYIASHRTTRKRTNRISQLEFSVLLQSVVC